MKIKQQLINEINNKADAVQAIIEAEIEDPVEVKNKKVVNKIIREIDPHKKSAFFKFAHGSKPKFNELKPEIIEMINRFKPVNGLFFKVYYKVDGKTVPKSITF